MKTHLPFELLPSDTHRGIGKVRDRLGLFTGFETLGIGNMTVGLSGSILQAIVVPVKFRGAIPHKTAPAPSLYHYDTVSWGSV